MIPRKSKTLNKAAKQMTLNPRAFAYLLQQKRKARQENAE